MRDWICAAWEVLCEFRYDVARCRHARVRRRREAEELREREQFLADNLARFLMACHKHGIDEVEVARDQVSSKWARALNPLEELPDELDGGSRWPIIRASIESGVYSGCGGRNRAQVWNLPEGRWKTEAAGQIALFAA